MSRSVLGLDPGANLGWAVCRDGKIRASGVKSFTDNVSFGSMFHMFRSFLAGLQHNVGPLAAIAYELPFAGFGAAVPARITGGMVAHVLELAHVWKCRPLPVSVATLKKFATGSGKAQKPEMIRAAIGYRGFAVTELFEHEADAIHVARWGWNQILVKS